MSVVTATLIVVLVVVLVCGAVTLVALYTKGNVRASGRFRHAAFDIETTQKK